MGRSELIVRMHEAHDVPRRVANPLVQCVVQPAVGLGDELRDARLVPLEHGKRAVGRAAVDDDVLDVRPALRVDGAKRFPERSGSIEDRCDDRYM